MANGPDVPHPPLLQHVSSNDLVHFTSTPWCAALLSSPDLVPISTPSRIPKPESTEDSLFAETLNTERTVPACVTLYRAPTESKPFGETLTLLSLGTGVNGHPYTAQGGLLIVLLDEVMGQVVHLPEPRNGCYTATLKTDFKKPVQTPGVVLGRASVISAEGRKIWVRGTLEDGEGNVIVSAEGLWVQTRAKI